LPHGWQAGGHWHWHWHWCWHGGWDPLGVEGGEVAVGLLLLAPEAAEQEEEAAQEEWDEAEESEETKETLLGVLVVAVVLEPLEDEGWDKEEAEKVVAVRQSNAGAFDAAAAGCTCSDEVCISDKGELSEELGIAGDNHLEEGDCLQLSPYCRLGNTRAKRQASALKGGIVGPRGLTVLDAVGGAWASWDACDVGDVVLECKELPIEIHKLGLKCRGDCQCGKEGLHDH